VDEPDSGYRQAGIEEEFLFSMVISYLSSGLCSGLVDEPAVHF
jgi:hypothetical protein